MLDDHRQSATSDLLSEQDRRLAFATLEQALTQDRSLRDSLAELEGWIIKAAIARHATLQGAYRGLRVGCNTFHQKRLKHRLLRRRRL